MMSKATQRAATIPCASTRRRRTIALPWHAADSWIVKLRFGDRDIRRWRGLCRMSLDPARLSCLGRFFVSLVCLLSNSLVPTEPLGRTASGAGSMSAAPPERIECRKRRCEKCVACPLRRFRTCRHASRVACDALHSLGRRVTWP